MARTFDLGGKQGLASSGSGRRIYFLGLYRFR
jgi:hypothetical protein